MAFQHQVMDTIVAMKAAIQRRADTSDSDDSNSDDHRPLNLKRKQRYTRHGQHGDVDGPPAWKRKVEHAGYNRYVINRNAPRFDIDGDIVPPPEDDDEENEIDYQDWADVENNIYAGIDLEEIFAPLTAAAGLVDHPALSAPYTSQHLTDMTGDAADLVRKEQVALWRAKRVMVKLRGDMSWVPCGIMETSYDRYIKGLPQTTNGTASSSTVNGTHSQRAEDNVSTPKLAGTATLSNSVPATNETVNNGEVASRNGASTQNGDVDMIDQSAIEHEGAQQNGTNEEKKGDTMEPNGEKPSTEKVATNGDGHHSSTEPNSIPKVETNGDVHSPKSAASIDGSSDGSSQANSHRMTTRARAQEEAIEPSHPTSPLQSHPPIHPFFNFPTSILPDPDFGLPPSEAEETRALLLAFIQKHEEIVRNANELHHEMMRADRMRKDVYKWCKADGHVGEMSDGEDWYDEEEWGLDGPLVKGRDEEEEAQVGDVGKKTRQRRGREDR